MALDWSEATTLIGAAHAAADIYELARLHAADGQLADLTVAMTAINNWKRLAIDVGSVQGTRVVSGGTA